MTIYTDTGDNTSAKRVLRIRDAADGITTNGISDASILEKLEKSDRWIEVQTGKAEGGWEETDAKWEVVLEASENRTASKIPGILKETYDKLERDYRNSVKAINNKDSETQQTGISPIAEGVNIMNDLDPAVYLPDQDVWTNE